MSETTKATLGVFAICAIVWLATIGIMSAIYYEPVAEIDTTGWRQEQIERLELWMQ